MKISIISKAVCAVAIMFSLSSFASDKKEKNETTSSSNKVAFNAAVLQVGTTHKVKLAVDRSADSRLRVVLKNKAGKTFYSEVYGKGDLQYRRVFDLEDLNDGNYYFELTAGDKTITKEVGIHTNNERVISFE